jgi:hypothetical protein
VHSIQACILSLLTVMVMCLPAICFASYPADILSQPSLVWTINSSKMLFYSEALDSLETIRVFQAGVVPSGFYWKANTCLCNDPNLTCDIGEAYYVFDDDGYIDGGGCEWTPLQPGQVPPKPGLRFDCVNVACY